MTPQEAIEKLTKIKAETDSYGKKCINKAIKALEKQIPEKPTYTGEKNVYGAVVRICNECGDKVCISPMAKEYENYCRSCGKRLTEWSDTE